MIKIKSYTDFEQSRKLSEFLPVETADMCWTNHYYGELRSSLRVSSKSIEEYKNMLESFHDSTDADVFYPCWSLAALLDILPDELKDDDGDIYRNLAYHLKGKYTVHYPRLTTLWPSIYTEKADNLVDACYKLIVKLHDDNIL